MNSRQRVITALNHQETDRVPFDCPLGYTAYQNLVRYLDFKEPVPLKATNPDLNVRPSLELLKELNVDVVYIGLSGSGDEPFFSYGMDRYVDEWGIGYRKIEGNFAISYEAVDHPLKDARLEDLQDYPWPNPLDPARIDGLEERCRLLFENTDLAIIGRFNTPIFEQAFLLRGFEQLLIDVLSDPEFACALLDKTTEIAIGMLDAGMNCCGKYLQILRLAGDDMGHQQGTIFSPRVFRSVIKPRFARLYHHAKTLLGRFHPQGKLMAHTDGDVYALIPDYLEMGLDVLNPVQPRVSHMEHEVLKREFGDRLSFHGGIDIQRTMPFGTPEEVKQEARRAMKILGAGGGYILAPTHYLQADTPPENIVALSQAVL
jgi:uroporphyrinogen decarboxylase